MVLLCYPIFSLLPQPRRWSEAKKYNKTVNFENKPPKYEKKAPYAEPLRKWATGSLYLRIMVLVLDLVLVINMMVRARANFLPLLGTVISKTKAPHVSFTSWTIVWCCLVRWLAQSNILQQQWMLDPFRQALRTSPLESHYACLLSLNNRVLRSTNHLSIRPSLFSSAV